MNQPGLSSKHLLTGRAVTAKGIYVVMSAPDMSVFELKAQRAFVELYNPAQTPD